MARSERSSSRTHRSLRNLSGHEPSTIVMSGTPRKNPFLLRRFEQTLTRGVKSCRTAKVEGVSGRTGGAAGSILRENQLVGIRSLIAAGRGRAESSAWSRIRRSLWLAVAMSVLSSGSAAGAMSVVGGSTIQIEAAPWSVVIQDQAPTSRHLCTGSIVNASFILTAAHCVFDEAGTITEPSRLTVEAGVSNFLAPLATDAEQVRTVSAFIVDPGYVWSTQLAPDDIAVLALSRPLDLTGPAAQAIPLPAPDAAFPAGATVGLAGFGEQTSGIFPTGPLTSLTATVDAQGSCGATNSGVLSD